MDLRGDDDMKRNRPLVGAMLVVVLSVTDLGVVMAQSSSPFVPKGFNVPESLETP